MCLEMLGQVMAINTADTQPPNRDVDGVPDRTAIVNVNGTTHRVSLAVLDLEVTDVWPGDWILSHTGLALRVVDEADAMKLRDERNEMYADLAASPPPDRATPRNEGTP